MRRVGLSALLIACLVTFLCPEVAKPNVVTVTKVPDCCSKMSGCKMTHQQTSHHQPCRHESQPNSCCAVSCSTLILFCPVSDGFTTPRFNGRRLRRRGFDSLPQLRLGAKHARTTCVFTQPRIHEISTGENHEISAFDCSNYDADERDYDLVQ